MHDTTCARRQMLLGLSHARPLLVPTPRLGVARQCPLAAALAAGGRRRRRNAAAEHNDRQIRGITTHSGSGLGHDRNFRKYIKRRSEIFAAKTCGNLQFLLWQAA